MACLIVADFGKDVDGDVVDQQVCTRKQSIFVFFAHTGIFDIILEEKQIRSLRSRQEAQQQKKHHRENTNTSAPDGRFVHYIEQSEMEQTQPAYCTVHGVNVILSLTILRSLCGACQEKEMRENSAEILMRASTAFRMGTLTKISRTSGVRLFRSVKPSLLKWSDE